MTVLIQHFSVPAGNDVQVALLVSPDVTLDGTIYWRAYEQEFGIPLDDLTSPPSYLIEKSSSDGTITVGSPLSCDIQISAADTAELLRNYYHEATLVDSSGNVSTLSYGIMTVTQTLYE